MKNKINTYDCYCKIYMKQNILNVERFTRRRNRKCSTNRSFTKYFLYDDSSRLTESGRPRRMGKRRVNLEFLSWWCLTFFCELEFICLLTPFNSRVSIEVDTEHSQSLQWLFSSFGTNRNTAVRWLKSYLLFNGTTPTVFFIDVSLDLSSKKNCHALLSCLKMC